MYLRMEPVFQLQQTGQSTNKAAWRLCPSMGAEQIVKVRCSSGKGLCQTLLTGHSPHLCDLLFCKLLTPKDCRIAPLPTARPAALLICLLIILIGVEDCYIGIGQQVHTPLYVPRAYQIITCTIAILPTSQFSGRPRMQDPFSIWSW